MYAFCINLLFILKYGDDVKTLSSSVNPMDEPTHLATFCNRVLPRIFKNKEGENVTLGRKIVHSEERHDFYYSQNIIWMIKWRKCYGRSYGTYCNHLNPIQFLIEKIRKREATWVN